MPNPPLPAKPLQVRAVSLTPEQHNVPSIAQGATTQARLVKAQCLPAGSRASHPTRALHLHGSAMESGLAQYLSWHHDTTKLAEPCLSLAHRLVALRCMGQCMEMLPPAFAFDVHGSMLMSMLAISAKLSTQAIPSFHQDVCRVWMLSSALPSGSLASGICSWFGYCPVSIYLPGRVQWGGFSSIGRAG